ncbi:17-beta-hydroxysteroid dehydrogenase 14 isoform X2 [Ambystoma mexicanum]|uniref:17-beta-hydroxysteroid dehydrogenase 14 isoform X2 n=1 Tax=Ambystoma mexicanum TaxID=8296 RepID=UPI0037E849B5
MATVPAPETSLRYRDRVAIVTGGTKGIGEAIVRLFEEAAGDLEAELSLSFPGNSVYVRCDVTSEEDIKRLIEVTLERYGQIDCLVNNAGWHPPEQTIDDTSAEDFRNLLNLNLIGYFLAAKYALPHLRKTKGNVVNISSLVGLIGQNNAIPYVATKGAITSMTKAMAVDESKYGVRVNGISPGNIWTPLWEELSSASPNPESMIKGGRDAQAHHMTQWYCGIPRCHGTWNAMPDKAHGYWLLGRMGTPEECAQATLYLAAEGTFCTGIDLLLSGGAELNYACKNQTVSRSSIYH